MRVLLWKWAIILEDLPFRELRIYGLGSDDREYLGTALERVIAYNVIFRKN